MTINDENQFEDGHMDGAEWAPEWCVSRRSLLTTMSLWSLPRKVSLASAALFAGIAARGTPPALADPGPGYTNWLCCNLGNANVWCAPAGGDPPFSCDHHGGVRRVWYCCQANHLVGCGECVNGGTCSSGPPYYCSYGWFYEYQYC